MKKAFTLIELLVVVLIIGVLAAIALPQYQKSVEKARSAEALINLKALVNAMDLYKLANGEVTTKLDLLDIQLSGTLSTSSRIDVGNFSFQVAKYSKGTNYEVIAYRMNPTSDLMNYYIYHRYDGGTYCVARKEAAKVPCSAVCMSNEFRPISSTGPTCVVSPAAVEGTDSGAPPEAA